MSRNQTIEALLRKSVPAVQAQPAPARDLWPALQHRLLHESPEELPAASIPWFDWALAGALIAFLGFFPQAIPLVLYHL